MWDKRGAYLYIFKLMYSPLSQKIDLHNTISFLLFGSYRCTHVFGYIFFCIFIGFCVYPLHQYSWEKRTSWILQHCFILFMIMKVTYTHNRHIKRLSMKILNEINTKRCLLKSVFFYRFIAQEKIEIKQKIFTKI